MGDAQSIAIAKYNQLQDSECEAVPEEAKQAVRMLVGANAIGETLAEQAADATELMMALGIHWSQDEDPAYLSKIAPLPNSPASFFHTT